MSTSSAKTEVQAHSRYAALLFSLLQVSGERSLFY